MALCKRCTVFLSIEIGPLTISCHIQWQPRQAFGPLSDLILNQSLERSLDLFPSFGELVVIRGILIIRCQAVRSSHGNWSGRPDTAALLKIQKLRHLDKLAAA